MALERFFHSLWSLAALDAFASAAAQYGLYACIAAAAAAWLRRRPHHIVIPFLAGAAGAAVLNVLAGLIHYDPRPFVALHVAPLVPHGIDNGFPSDHSAAAAYVATFATILDPAFGALAWSATVVLGVARLYCLLHNPQDVMAGWIIGTAPAIAAGLYWRNRWTTVSSPPHSK
jgi:undecaprenyl-diphosphatase